jgi:Rod binding domain-containing protein
MIKPLSANTISLQSDPTKTKGRKDAEKVGQDFESYFITTMLKELEKTTHLTKKSYGEETYMSIMYEKLGDYLAKKGLGIKGMIQKYVERADAVADTAKVFQENGDNRDK